MANRVVLGAFDNTFVLRVSRPGNNVLDTALAPEKLSFDSRWNSLLKVVQQGTIRGTMAYVDMVGWQWYANIYIPPSLYVAGNFPLIICSVRPHYPDYKAQIFVGGAFSNGWNPSTGILSITAETGTWWPAEGRVGGNQKAWGYFDYYLVKN
jgi:hypothetical protein